jgi:peptidoglycan/xylan/chitin deacetylase (PgdA/CDA1 family)
LMYNLISPVALELPDHYRPRNYAPLWGQAPTDWRRRLADTLEKGCSSQPPQVYFRADGIGAGGRAFDALCRLFRLFEVPLALAVVPSWISEIRKEQLFASAPPTEPLWDWLQNGWRHVNWQRTGVKSEFGEHRPFEKQWKDIWQGRQKMQDIFGSSLLPVFTPPWNNLSAATLRVLHELEFRGITALGGVHRGFKYPASLKNIRIHLDLHVRNGKDGASDFRSLLEDLSALLTKKEPFGVVIQHHRMTPFAFQFLQELLRFLKHAAQARFFSFRELMDTPDGQ